MADANQGEIFEAGQPKTLVETMHEFLPADLSPTFVDLMILMAERELEDHGVGFLFNNSALMIMIDLSSPNRELVLATLREHAQIDIHLPEGDEGFSIYELDLGGDAGRFHSEVILPEVVTRLDAALAGMSFEEYNAFMEQAMGEISDQGNSSAE